MGKPRLPKEIENKFPVEITRLINKYIPPFPKPKPLSLGLQTCLEKLQRSPKRNAMDLYGLEDFILC